MSTPDVDVLYERLRQLEARLDHESKNWHSSLDKLFSALQQTNSRLYEPQNGNPALFERMAVVEWSLAIIRWVGIVLVGSVIALGFERLKALLS